MLQKDGFFRRRDEGLFRQNQPIAPTPAPAANATPASPSHAEPKADERKEAKLVVGPDIKMKGAEISDCDTLVVEGRMEATLDSRVLEITQHGVFQGTIAVDNAEIHGRFEGELTVRKQLIIQAPARSPARSATPRSRSRKAPSSPARSRCSTSRPARLA